MATLIHTARGWLPVKDVTLEELIVFRDKIDVAKPHGTEYWKAVDHLVQVSQELVRRMEEEFNAAS